jgi:hypothetical protein
MRIARAALAALRCAGIAAGCGSMAISFVDDAGRGGVVSAIAATGRE